MFGSEFSFSDFATKKHVWLQVKHQALSAIDDAVCDGSITIAEAEVLKSQVVATSIIGGLAVNLERPIEGISGKAEGLGRKIFHTLRQTRG